MGLLDLLFGKKKEGKSSIYNTKTEVEAQLVVSTPVNASRLVHKATELSIKPFVFESNQHQRYENGNPVQGLQECPRTIKVEKNINGCSGYQLKIGDGYIVRIINGDTGQPQMSAKPMHVIKSSASEIELRGYMVSAQTPFGYQDIDMADYGLSVFLKENKVVKCILHMYDRNVNIEYQKVASNTASQCTTKISEKKDFTETELYVNQALAQLAAHNDGDAVYHPLYKAWRSFQQNPQQLKSIVNPGQFGRGMMVFLSYGTVSDIDDQQQIASIGYLFLSLAIKKKPNDINWILTRLIIILNNKEAFEYTVSSVVNKDTIMMFMNLGAFKSRNSLLKMEYADLIKDPRLLSVDLFANVYQDIRGKIQSGFFGQNESEGSVISEGNRLHEDITNYLLNKVLQDNDIDF